MTALLQPRPFARAAIAPSPCGLCLLLALVLAMPGAARPGVEALEFSPDGRRLAVLDDHGGLTVLGADVRERQAAVRGEARGDRVGWDMASERLAAVLDRGRGWDIWLVGEGEQGRTRLTLHPGADASPQFTPDGKSLVFTSWREKDADLYLFDIDSLEARPFVARPHDQWGARIRPGRQAIAYFTMETGALELWLAAPGQEPFSVAVLDPWGHFPIEPAAAWSTDAGRLLYVVHDRQEDRLEAYDPDQRSVAVLTRGPSLARPAWSRETGCLYYQGRDGFYLERTSGFHPFGMGRKRRLLVRGAPVEHAAPAPGEARGAPQRLALALEGGGLALGRTPARDFSLFFLSLDEQLDYARRLADRGGLENAEAVYRSLEAERLEPEQRARLRLQRLASLRGAGRPGRFQAAIDSLAELRGAGLEPRDILMLRAEAALFEDNDLEAARDLLAKTGEAPGIAPFLPGNALRVLDADDKRLTEACIDAHAALRGDDPDEAIDALRRAMRSRAPTELVTAITLEVLDDVYDRDPRSDWGSRFQAAGLSHKVADLIQRLLDRMDKPRFGPVTDADRAAAQAEGLRYLVLSEEYRAARRCMEDLLSRPEGFLHFDAPDLLANFIHGDRPDAWARNLLQHVFLHPELEEAREAAFAGQPELRVLETLARIKMEVLRGDVAAAAPLLPRALQRLRELRNDHLASEIGPLRLHLQIWEARCHELVGNWEAALSAYSAARATVLAARPEWTTLYLRIQAAAAEIAAGLDQPQVLEQISAIRAETCDFLLESETDRDLIRDKAGRLNRLLAETSPSPLDTFLLFRIGATLSRGQMEHYATHYLDRAFDAAPPDQLRPAILWEKASLLGACERHWLRWRTCATLLEAGEEPVVADAARLQTAACMMNLGLASRALALLKNLRASTPIAAFNDAAAQMQQELEPVY